MFKPGPWTIHAIPGCSFDDRGCWGWGGDADSGALCSQPNARALTPRHRKRKGRSAHAPPLSGTASSRPSPTGLDAQHIYRVALIIANIKSRMPRWLDQENSQQAYSGCAERRSLLLGKGLGSVLYPIQARAWLAGTSILGRPSCVSVLDVAARIHRCHRKSRSTAESGQGRVAAKVPLFQSLAES